MSRTALDVELMQPLSAFNVLCLICVSSVVRGPWEKADRGLGSGIAAELHLRCGRLGCEPLYVLRSTPLVRFLLAKHSCQCTRTPYSLRESRLTSAISGLGLTTFSLNSRKLVSQRGKLDNTADAVFGTVVMSPRSIQLSSFAPAREEHSMQPVSRSSSSIHPVPCS